jgi:hypothetical protein
MNSHQRRKDSRRRHMALPLSKEIDPLCLRGHIVYVLGKYQRKEYIPLDWKTDGCTARISRHIFPHGVTLDIIRPDGEEIYANTTTAGLRLLKSADRAPRPWWAELRRRRKNPSTPRR